MSGDACRTVWANAGWHNKAAELDAAFPNCACEAWSLVAEDELAVADEEPVARVLTSPGMYTNDDIITQKLTAAAAGGVSIIRSGASDQEILDTISNLVENQAETQTLVGAVVVQASQIRSLGDAEKWFGVYHTIAPNKASHGDILATTPAGTSSQRKRLHQERRYRLRDVMRNSIVFATEPDELLAALRQAGL